MNSFTIKIKIETPNNFFLKTKLQLKTFSEELSTILARTIIHKTFLNPKNFEITIHNISKTK
jgi:hypothetical protein